MVTLCFFGIFREVFSSDGGRKSQVVEKPQKPF